MYGNQSYPVPSNISSVDEVFRFADTVVGNTLGVGILFMVFIVTFLKTLQYGYDYFDSFIASSFIMFFTSLFLAAFGLLGTLYYRFALALFVLSIMAMVFRKKPA